jgi:flagellar biosynthesis protein FlhB
MTEKKHQPSHKKIKRSLEKGECPQFSALSQWITVLVVFALLPWLVDTSKHEVYGMLDMLIRPQNGRLFLVELQPLVFAAIARACICSITVLLIGSVAVIMLTALLRGGQQPTIALRFRGQVMNPLLAHTRIMSGGVQQAKNAFASLVMLVIALGVGFSLRPVLYNCLVGGVSASEFLTIGIRPVLILGFAGSSIALLFAVFELRRFKAKLMMTDE